MPITRIPYPNALPTEQNDYVKQNDLLEIGFQRVNDPAPIDFTGGNVLQGAVFQCGGTVYYTDADTAIGGAASPYVQLTPTGGGATLTPAYVANLAGVTWNPAYNGYYDGGGALYVFDEGAAMQAGEIAAVVGRYVMQTRDGDVYVGRDVLVGGDIDLSPGGGTKTIQFSSAPGAAAILYFETDNLIVPSVPIVQSPEYILATATENAIYDTFKLLRPSGSLFTLCILSGAATLTAGGGIVIFSYAERTAANEVTLRYYNISAGAVGTTVCVDGSADVNFTAGHIVMHS